VCSPGSGVGRIRVCSPEELLCSTRGVVVAPAGCGKTHLIAQAVASQSQGRQLILTHTHSGVAALRKRLFELGASSSLFHLTTIASWCLLYSRSFPVTSGIKTGKPRTQVEWESIYAGTIQVLNDPSIARVPAFSYSGVLVDEYQDCTKSQHKVIVALADLVPTRVLGDPLQAIFDFGGNAPVDWEADVQPAFDALPELDEPWRWLNGSTELGQWLGDVRLELLNGGAVDLRTAPAEAVEWVPLSENDRTSKQIGICYKMLEAKYGSVAAIHDMPNQARYIASRLKGRFQCAEANECPDLLKHAARIENTEGPDRALSVIEFVGACIAGLKTELGGVRSRLKSGNLPNPNRARKHVSLVEEVIRVADSTSMEHVESLTAELIAIPNLPAYRREVLRDFKRGVRRLIEEGSDSLVAAVWEVRDVARRTSRRMPRHVIGTTKLLKGLEFDTVVLLNPADFGRKDLYVALTRASSRLIILSGCPVLSPED